jgi:L-alanine-DL-glutamate epimerase-like enolase superfamily enzyme
VIITRVEVTRLRQVPFPVPLKPTWSFGRTWSGVSRVLVRIHTDKSYLRAPQGPGLGIELDEALIRAYAMD